MIISAPPLLSKNSASGPAGLTAERPQLPRRAPAAHAGAMMGCLKVGAALDGGRRHLLHLLVPPHLTHRYTHARVTPTAATTDHRACALNIAH